MDRIDKNKAIVKEVLEEIAAMTPPDEQTETQIIIDETRGHFLLMDVGWQDVYRTYLPFVHLDVKPDGKIWIQHDGTDLNIAMLLVERGISKKDIVLAFHAPHRRKHIPEFAIE